MTPKEHELMIAMLAKQSRYVKVLIDLLTEKCGVPASEIPAMEFSVQKDSVLRDHLYRGTFDSYLQSAKALDIQTGLEDSK